MSITSSSTTFDAFISYAHADDAAAAALQSHLGRLMRRPFRRRHLVVFRDETSLQPGSSLNDRLTGALAASSWLVVLLSQASAASYWVAEEIRHWVHTHDGATDRILFVRCDATVDMRWSPEGRPLAPDTLPAPVGEYVTSEPLFIDCAERTPEWDRRAAILIASAILSKAPDDIAGEDLRQHRRMRAIGISGVTALALLTVAAVVAGVVANTQRNSADRARRSAELALAQSDSQRFATAASAAGTVQQAATFALAAYSAALASGEQPDAAVAPVVQALARTDLPNARFMGRAENPEHTGEDQGVAVSADGTTLAYIEAGGTVGVVDLTTGTQRSFTVPDRTFAAEQVALNADGSGLLVAGLVLGVGEYPTYQAAVRTFAVAGDALAAQHSGTVEVYGAGLMAVAFGAGERVVAVEASGVVNLLDPVADGWAATKLGDPRDRTMADTASARFSLDGTAVCIAGVGPDPAEVWVSEYSLVGNGSLTFTEPIGANACFPGPCAQISDGPSVVSAEGVACAGADAAEPLVPCVVCASVHGLDVDTQFVDASFIPTGLGAGGLDAGRLDDVARVWAVPAPDGAQFVAASRQGNIDVWSTGSGLLVPVVAVDFTAEVMNVVAGSDGGADGYTIATDGSVAAIGDTAAVPADAVASAASTDGPLLFPDALRLLPDGSLATVSYPDFPVGDEVHLVVQSRQGTRLDRSLSYVGTHNVDIHDRWAAIGTDAGLEIIDLATGEAVIESSGDAVCAVDWSQSGRLLLVVPCAIATGAGVDSGDRARLIAFDSGTVGDERALDLGGAGGPLPLSHVSVSDDGSTIAFSSYGPIQVWHDGAWVSPLALRSEQPPLNGNPQGWAEVDTSGAWIVIDRGNGEDMGLWAIDGLSLQLMGRLGPGSQWPPAGVAFADGRLALLWRPWFDHLNGGVQEWHFPVADVLAAACAAAQVTSATPQLVGLDRYPTPC